MRTRVTREWTFDAAHQLPWHSGKCRNLHGHTYRLEVVLEGPLTESGIVVDFGDLDVLARQVLNRYDHVYLNDLLDNPTAELVAAALWKDLERGLTGPARRLARLRLWETPDCSVEILP